MKINVIAAIGKNNEIGLNNQLLWKSKSDLEHFKQLTLGKPIIMGRKTFESLPGILPDRTHIVITSQDKWHPKFNLAHSVKPSLTAAIAEAKGFGCDEVFIIGGASIYEQALPLAEELHISHMDWTGEADTYFPTIGSEWERNSTAVITKGINSPDWTYVKYTRTLANKENIT